MGAPGHNEACRCSLCAQFGKSSGVRMTGGLVVEVNDRPPIMRSTASVATPRPTIAAAKLADEMLAAPGAPAATPEHRDQLIAALEADPRMVDVLQDSLALHKEEHWRGWETSRRQVDEAPDPTSRERFEQWWTTRSHK